MSPRLLDSLAALFRDARQNAGACPLFACFAASDSEGERIKNSTRISDKIAALRRQYERAQLAHFVIDDYGCRLKGPEAVIHKKLFDLAHDPARPRYLRDRANKAKSAYVKKRTQKLLFSTLSFTVAKARHENYCEDIYFPDIDSQIPSRTKYVDTAHQAWANCHAEHFAAQVGITRPELEVAGEGERSFVRWIALVFRTLFDAGEIQSDSIVKGVNLYWFPADIWTATLAAIDVLASHPETPKPTIQLTSPKWDRLMKRLTIDKETITVAVREAPALFGILDLLENADWPSQAVAVPSTFGHSIKDGVDTLNTKLAATRLRILRLNGNRRIGWKLLPNHPR